MQVCTPLRPAPSFKLRTLWVDHTDTLYSYLHFQAVSPAPVLAPKSYIPGKHSVSEKPGW